MHKQILIDDALSFMRIGILSEGTLHQVYIQDEEDVLSQNTVVQGQVQKVVKNLKAAFIDFGKDKNGLLHFSGVPETYLKHLQPGMRLPVQVQKENKGEKGDRLTAMVSIQGYYLVALPFETGIQISKKIKDKHIKAELKSWIEEVALEDVGFIVRTNAEKASKEELIDEAAFLLEKVTQFRKMKDAMQKGTTLIEMDSLYWQVIKEHVTPEDSVEIICNNDQILKDVEERQKVFLKNVEFTYKVYPYCENIFRLFSIEKDFMDLLKRKIWLKNGGNIVVDYTEAMTVIDVNSAKAIEGKNSNVAVRKLNELAIEESLYQIMRRNLSGIIIIDLVDLKSKEDRIQLYEFAKKRFMALDGRRSKIYPLTELDLLQITRTKKYLPIHQKLKTAEGEYHFNYIFFEIEQKIKLTASETAMKQIYLYGHSELLTWIKTTERDRLIEETYGIKLHLIEKTSLSKRSYEIKYHLA